VDRFRTRVRLGKRGVPEFLAGRDLSDVLAAEADGTARALVEKGRPLVKLQLPSINPQSIGALLLLQQLQTALAGALYGVDPFTQPGVDAGKQAALEILANRD
jgi:glucose-6-phosphate isomerase